MSTEALIEAVAIVKAALHETHEAHDEERARYIVDKLNETHSISRRGPRVLVRSRERPAIATLAGQKPNGRTLV